MVEAEWESKMLLEGTNLHPLQVPAHIWTSLKHLQFQPQDRSWAQLESPGAVLQTDQSTWAGVSAKPSPFLMLLLINQESSQNTNLTEQLTTVSTAFP